MYTAPTETPEDESEPKTRPAGSPFKRTADTRTISMLGLGMVIGAAIGAGIALVAAPQSGEEARNRILDRVRHLRGRDDSTWEKLGREFKRAAKVRRLELRERRTRHERAVLEREQASQDAGVKPD